MEVVLKYLTTQSESSESVHLHGGSQNTAGAREAHGFASNINNHEAADLKLS